MENNEPIFDRLVGLETEYAIRFRPGVSTRSRPAKCRFFAALVTCLERLTPTVAAKHFKEGQFLANGGAVWFETPDYTRDAGLIEGSSPECRGARQVVSYQRAQDRLLSQAAGQADMDGEFSLVKNSGDSRGNKYGAQENYEANLAAGWRLIFWRAGLVATLPLAFLTWVGLYFFIVTLIVYLLTAGALGLLCGLVSPRARQFLLGEFTEIRWLPPGWLGKSLLVFERLLTAPLASAVFLLSWLFAFRPTRDRLLPFLVSRAVIGGAGTIDRDGRFLIADKASSLNCVCGFGGFLKDRPIFTFGHFFKAIYAESWVSPREYFELFRSRQRLQLALGDSNMCETSEYLRVATTMLVLDAIEQEALKDAPVLQRPVKAMHQFCSDPTLDSQAKMSGGGLCSAVEIQRFYYDACQQFVAEFNGDVPDEVFEVLALWDGVLDSLENDPDSLCGRLDWVTKKYLIDQAADLSWEARKKIDIRYHELTDRGYFNEFAETGLVETIVPGEEIERATRTAPPGTPATMRGHYIREFADGDEPIRVNWKLVVVGKGRSSRRIRLAKYDTGRATRDERVRQA